MSMSDIFNTVSPIGARFMKTIAESHDLVELCTLAPPGGPAPMALMAACQYLLIEAADKGAEYPPLGRELASFFPAFAAATHQTLRPVDHPDFTEILFNFCTNPSNRDRLIPLIKTQTIQTTDVCRASNLLPAFLQVFHEARQRSQLLDVIEVRPPLSPSLPPLATPISHAHTQSSSDAAWDS